MYRATLVTSTADGKIHTEKIGEWVDKVKCMAAAKKAAGRNSKFIRKGEQFGYLGSKGFCWVT